MGAVAVGSRHGAIRLAIHLTIHPDGRMPEWHGEKQGKNKGATRACKALKVTFQFLQFHQFFGAACRVKPASLFLANDPEWPQKPLTNETILLLNDLLLFF